MSTSTVSPGFFGPLRPSKRKLWAIGIAAGLAISPFIIWPQLSARLLATNFMPHLYCYLRDSGLVWTHVVADSLIGLAYFAISVTLGYLVYKGQRDIPFHWMFLLLGFSLLPAAERTSWKWSQSGYRCMSCPRRLSFSLPRCRLRRQRCFLLQFRGYSGSRNKPKYLNKSRQSCAPARSERKLCCGKFIIE